MSSSESEWLPSSGSEDERDAVDAHSTSSNGSVDVVAAPVPARRSRATSRRALNHSDKDSAGGGDKEYLPSNRSDKDISRNRRIATRRPSRRGGSKYKKREIHDNEEENGEEEEETMRTTRTRTRAKTSSTMKRLRRQREINEDGSDDDDGGGGELATPIGPRKRAHVIDEDDDEPAILLSPRKRARVIDDDDVNERIVAVDDGSDDDVKAQHLPPDADSDAEEAACFAMGKKVQHLYLRKPCSKVDLITLDELEKVHVCARAGTQKVCYNLSTLKHISETVGRKLTGHATWMTPPHFRTPLDLNGDLAALIRERFDEDVFGVKVSTPTSWFDRGFESVFQDFVNRQTQNLPQLYVCPCCFMWLQEAYASRQAESQQHARKRDKEPDPLDVLMSTGYGEAGAAKISFRRITDVVKHLKEVHGIANPRNGIPEGLWAQFNLRDPDGLIQRHLNERSNRGRGHNSLGARQIYWCEDLDWQVVELDDGNDGVAGSSRSQGSLDDDTYGLDFIGDDGSTDRTSYKGLVHAYICHLVVNPDEADNDHPNVPETLVSREKMLTSNEFWQSTFVVDDDFDFVVEDGEEEVMGEEGEGSGDEDEEESDEGRRLGEGGSRSKKPGVHRRDAHSHAAMFHRINRENDEAYDLGFVKHMQQRSSQDREDSDSEEEDDETDGERAIEDEMTASSDSNDDSSDSVIVCVRTTQKSRERGGGRKQEDEQEAHSSSSSSSPAPATPSKSPSKKLHKAEDALARAARLLKEKRDRENRVTSTKKLKKKRRSRRNHDYGKVDDRDGYSANSPVKRGTAKNLATVTTHSSQTTPTRARRAVIDSDESSE